jgi:HEAT repeat protein
VIRTGVRALVVLLLAVTSCAPSACSDEEDRRLGRWVEALVGEPGPRADAAEEALVASGGEAILYLETGLYDAEPRARRRVVKTLARIGDRAALPILDHLARRDPDEAVRNAAGAAEKALEGASAP